jgi:hypothetical protein
MSEDGLVISSMAYYTAIRTCEIAGDWQTALHLGMHTYTTQCITATYHHASSIISLHTIARWCCVLPIVAL